jgi:hypothetical protein
MGDEAQGQGSQIIPVRGWKIRYDSPPDVGTAGRSESGDILGLFRAWDDAPCKDRRESERYTPARTQAWAGWWKRSRFLVSRANLVNLSNGGALVHMHNRPPTSQPIWICLGAPHPVDYVQCRVLDAALKPAGDFLVRVEFHAPCPPRFFLAAGHTVDEPGRGA